jgi:hypothetical protein
LTEYNDTIAQDFVSMLDSFHSAPECWDDELDSQLHRWYTNPPKIWPKRPYFSPSAAGSDARELYVKTLGAKRDSFGSHPWQARWTQIGTSIGDMIQRDVLLIGKHEPDAKFHFEFNANGQPMFEEFAKVNKRISYRGHTFYLYGQPDGIMRYTTLNGEELRVGLEIKSKQTTAAKTSLHTMREPEDKHVKQTVGYSIMYDLDDYIILYVNASKKSWNMTDEEYRKSPDIRAFHVRITRDDKLALCDYFADVLDAVKAKKPPALNIDKWTFNNYKTACAKSLSDQEFADIEALVNRMQHSSLGDKAKQEYADALEFIRSVRQDGGDAS